MENMKQILTLFLCFCVLSTCMLTAFAEDAAAEAEPPVVYFTSDISPEGLVAVYQARGRWRSSCPPESRPPAIICVPN